MPSSLPLVLALAAALAAGSPAGLSQPAATTASAAAPSPPAQPALSYAGRAARQQGFVQEYLAAHPPAAPLVTPADFDRYLAGLEAAWAGSLDESVRRDPVLARLDPSVAIMAMVSIPGADSQSWISCHVWTSQAVPRFLADFDVARSAPPTAERASLLGTVTLVNVFNDLATSCDLPAASWSRLAAAGHEGPGLVEAYLDRRAYPDEPAAERLREARHYLLSRQPVLALADVVRQGDTVRSREQLAAGLAGDAGVRADIGQLGLGLADLHRKRGERAAALDVLDLVARSTTPFEVFAESLRERYAQVDPEGGGERLRRAEASRLPLLAPTGEKVQLAGLYEDLATGKPLDLASLAGKTVVLDFWTTWCALCLTQVPKHHTLLETYGKDSKVAVLGVASDALSRGAKEDAVRKLVHAKGMKYPNIYDRLEGSWTERLGIRGWPAHVVIAPDGSVLATPGSSYRSVPLMVVEAYLAGQRNL